MITSLLNKMSDAYFWDKWRSKMLVNERKYVDPASREVRQLAQRLKILTNQTDKGIAEDISDWIASNYTYKLEKRWRRPRETINEQMGDCEDFTFLLSSLLPHFGVTDFSIVAGEAVTGDNRELHVWLEIDGEVVDPTASALQATNIDYNRELTFQITTESC